MNPIEVVLTSGSTAHVAVAGDLTLETGDVILRKLSNLLDRGYVHLVVDGSGVSFCDSTGLGALLRARARASSVAGGLTIRAASPQLQRVVRLAGLQKLLTGDEAEQVSE
ncbi:Stage II sporulation protein AA (Anti-sigma F factor antagonist) [Kibdelosporangium sp. 4NS15]|uniref:Stage II sporulation protein AA (Anti-sigma F factor antagonist) n=1 Tax=Kibdelosporangium persicum TaxID=2698649 RepID=A0ABX2F1K5_9PSEU|nr:STAS domain-containing protein [Kibdelosporangium persicum]NRN65172.1 Stage II sporulation protein AA (Anti-sigma F factor antagonist) [Kibdelosporangium persicum]